MGFLGKIVEPLPEIRPLREHGHALNPAAVAHRVGQSLHSFTAVLS